MAPPRWEFWVDRLQREVVAVAVVLTTTLGGWGTQSALADDAAPVRTSVVPVAAEIAELEPVDAALALGDSLAALSVELESVAEGRNQQNVLAQCDAVRSRAGALDRLDGAVRDDLRSAVQPALVLCENPLGASDSVSVDALEGYYRFRDRAFDLVP